MNERFTIKVDEYPGDAVLDPRWQDSTYVDKQGRTRLSRADVRVVPGADGPKVEAGRGTSAHDVPGW